MTLEEIREQRYAIHEAIAAHRKSFESKCAEEHAKLADLQRACPHTNQGYEPDPSGNNDSSWYCPDCGKESRRKL